MCKLMSLVNKVKEIMIKEVEDNPDLTDKEYEELFVKHYLSLIDTMTIPSTNSRGKSRV